MVFGISPEIFTLKLPLYPAVKDIFVELIKLLLTKDNNLFAVGDDWQSIYGFRGSEVVFIVNFNKDFIDMKRIILPFNYRSGESIVEASNIVIRKNPNQIDKKIEAFSKKNDEKIFQYNAINELDGAKFVVEAAKNYSQKGYSFQDILFLYRRTLHLIPYREYFKSQNFKINAKTIHGSKGLEANIVFLIGLSSGCFGFPYVWEDERIIQIIKKTDLIKKEEEERRIFYVAMTRAKERLFLISEKNNESEYCEDIPPKFKTVEVSKAEYTEEMLHGALLGTFNLVKEGKSADEIAKSEGKEAQRIEMQIAKLIEYGLLDIKLFVDDDTYKLIRLEIPEDKKNLRLSPIKKALPKNITFAQIRYVIADLKSKNG